MQSEKQSSELGFKLAADPRPTNPDPTGFVRGSNKNTALVGGASANLTPEYSGTYFATPAGLQHRKERHLDRQHVFANQIVGAQTDMRRNRAQERDMNLLSVMSGLAPAVGSAVGQPMLGAAVGAAGTVTGGLGAHNARLERPFLQDYLQRQQENYNSVTPPNKRWPDLLRKAGSCLEFGVKLAKVYEAGEAVDGLSVKHTKMNHKKCTPGEFGTMVKESADSVIAPQPRPVLGPMANRALKSQVPAYQNRMQHGQRAMDKIMGNPALSQPASLALKSAHDFGAYVKQSFLEQVQQHLPAMQQHLPAIGTGAAMGAGLAGLHGFMSPGEEDEYDAQGRVVGRKQRSRLGTMLNRALMGAGVGGAAMGVGSAMFPQYVNPALQKLYGMFQSQQTPSNYGQPGGSIGPPEEARLAFKPQSQQSLNDNIGEEYGAGPKLPQSPVPPMLLP